ncbi:substrate-binding periplasmic protein [Roseibium sp.]|uniref:substrate-binding periplasmic protein n=1 Tax=Roseibium sp. TaxID=1936156 RepID=UPI0039EE8A0E
MRKFCAAFMVMAAITSNASAKEAITLGTGDSLPFASVGSDGAPIGVLGDASSQLLQDMGFEAQATKLPFARLYNSIHSGEIDVAIGVLRTDERAGKALYSDPILTTYNILVVKKGNGFDYASLKDLSSKKIGGRRGFAYPTLEAAGVSVEPAKDDDTNMKKVLAGRLDAAIISSIAFLPRLDQSDIRSKVELLPLAVGVVPIGIALADERFSAEDVARFNEMLSGYKASDAYSQALAKYGIADYVKDWPVAE